MRLYRQGDSGAAVRDIQDRLTGLGHDCAPDLRGNFGPATAAAVRSFQKSKGLATDEIVGPDTWRALYEAGFRLGDRLLFYRRPMFRGEDVADLQSRLNGLGFDSGKVDGIFGPDTEAAVVEFQHNRGLAEDGKVGPDVVTEIRLVTRGTLQRGREAVREAEWLRRLPPTLVGSRIYFDAGCRSPEESRSTWDAASAAALELQERGGIPVLSRSQDTMLPARVRARRANRMGADIIVAFQTHDVESEGVFYFETSHSTSRAGELLAKAISKVIGGPMAGRATALLRETRAPAVVVSRAVLNPDVGRAVVDGIDLFFAEAGAQPMKDR